MITDQRRGGLVILVVFAIALILAVMPLPDWARLFRPAWVTLSLIYWCLALPTRLGIGSAWLLGIAADVMTGSLLGQHALALATISWAVIKIHRQMRQFPIWQQAIIVFLLLLFERVISFWTLGWTGQPLPDKGFWLAPVIGMLLWPWLYIILRDLRRRFRVN